MEEVLPMTVLSTGLLLNNGPPGKPYCTTLHFTSYLNVLKLQLFWKDLLVMIFSKPF